MSDSRAVVRDVLAGLCRALADYPALVDVNWDEHGDVLHVQAHRADVSRLLGDKGKTKRALKTIAVACSKASGENFDIDVTPVAGPAESD